MRLKRRTFAWAGSFIRARRARRPTGDGRPKSTDSFKSWEYCDSMLKVYLSNRLEILVDELADKLRSPLDNLFDRERIAVSEWDWRGDTEANFMVRAGAWKFICPYTRKSKVTNALYNLEDDPHEMTNLIGANPDRARHARQAEEMKSRLVAWLESMGSPHLDGVKERRVVR